MPKGLVLGQISVLLGKWLFRRPKEKQASSDAADAGLGVSADAGRTVATLSGRVYVWRKVGMLGQNLLLPVAVFVWQCVHMLEQNFSY